MLPTIICHTCSELLTDASTALRRHASLMHTSIQLAKTGLTDEQRKDFEDRLVTSFNDAQSAWDAYREHLVKHGLLPFKPDVAGVNPTKLS